MNEKNGRVKMIIGTLYSGKSTRLIQELERAALAHKKVLFVRPKLDTRDYLSRLIPSIEGIPITKVDRLEEIPGLLTYDCLFIDEFQFFDKSVADEINNLASQGITIIVAALNANINQELFESVQALLPLTEEIIKLNSICPECGSEYANIVYRTDGGKDASITKENVETSKGEDLYKICCRRCWYIMNQKYKKESR